ncbi:MAG: NACHT domain-containing protein [Symploca sp. SIO2E9]|nr:NACHT domain-containing protein [Symploca sp. SIO2E9]
MPKKRRKRGVVLTPEGLKKIEQTRKELEFNDNYGERYTLEQLSEITGLDFHTIKRVLACQQGVDKRTLERFFISFNLELTDSCYSSPNPHKRQDFGEAICVADFYGRAKELSALEELLLRARCRLVTILGMGGMGKTALSVKLAQQVQDKFDCVIWRSLRDAPPVETILANLIQFLCDEQESEVDLPENLGDIISKLIDILRQQRCLLVLDNWESLLRSGSRAGQHRKGYEGYGELLRRVGEADHQSCLLLTTREKPKEVASLEGEALPVRSFRLFGFHEGEEQEIFRFKGLAASEGEFRALAEHYAGNPLALKVVATTIQDVFDGQISKFLQQETVVFGDIRDLLDQQYERLLGLESEIMYWLAINREQVSLSELREDMVSPVPQLKLLEAIESLLRRSLVEKNGTSFTLQPVVMEYVTGHLIELVCEEITEQEVDLFRCHALIKATAKDYVRETQIRLILQPVIDGLLRVLNSKKKIDKHLVQFLERQREESPLEPGYAAGNILNLLCHLGIDLTGYDFSELCVWQADTRCLELYDVNFTNANLAKSVFAETFGGILSVAFSPDGKLLATGDMNSEIRLYQVGDWQQLFTLRGHTDWVASIAFSPDSSTLVTCSTDKTIKLWNVSTGQCLNSLQGHDKGIWSVSVSPDGQTLASGSDDKTIKIWDVSTGQCLKTLQGHNDMVRAVIFTPDGQILASASMDRTLKLWDLSNDQCLRTFQGHDDVVWSATISPDGRLLASASADQTVRLWDISNAQCLTILRGHNDAPWSVNFNPDGKTLASGSWDQTVKLWNVSTGKCLKTLQGHNNMVRAVALSPDGEMLASGSDDQSLRLWDFSTGQCLKTLQGYSNRIWSVALSPDGQVLASCSNSKMVKLWDFNTGQCLRILSGHSNEIRSVSFSADNQIMASSGDDKTVRIWDLSTGKCCQTLQGHVGWIWSIAFSPEGQVLASGSHDQTLKLWDVKTGQCLKTLHEDSHGILSVTFNPEGQVLASGGTDQTIRLWDLKNSQCLKTLQGHSGWVFSVTFSPDGQTLCSGSQDQTLKLWDVKTGQCLKTLQGHSGWVFSVTFSPDGQTLCSGSLDQTIKLWDMKTGQCLKTLAEHSQGVLSVIFSPQEYILISSSEDETIRIWDISTGECMGCLRSKRPYEGMKITDVNGLTEATISTLKTLGALQPELTAGQNR